MKRNPLSVGGTDYPVDGREGRLVALHPVTGAIVASGRSRGELAAQIEGAES